VRRGGQRGRVGTALYSEVRVGHGDSDVVMIFWIMGGNVNVLSYADGEEYVLGVEALELVQADPWIYMNKISRQVD